MYFKYKVMLEENNTTNAIHLLEVYITSSDLDNDTDYKMSVCKIGNSNIR